MSMVKPIALSKNAFDATNNELFSFTSVGGNQVVKNRLTVRNNTDNSIVYSNIQETFAFNQMFPANTGVNGQYYNAFFNTYDINNNMSPDSNVIQFYCFTNPTLTFTNITNNSTIESSNFLFTVEYNQIEGELLDNLKFVLYNINGEILSESENLYSTHNPPLQINYLFEGMENNTSYQIQVFGVTINGTNISSEKITFEVRFENPAVYSKIDLENKCDDGYVQLRSNLVFIDGSSNPDPPEYIKDKAVDLSGLEHWVEWIQGYEVPSNFVLELWIQPVLLGEFCKLWNNSDLNKNIQLNLKRDIFDGETELKDCFEVYAIGENGYVRTYSNKVELLNNLSEIVVWIKKINNTWELILDVQKRIPNYLYWNERSNVEFNKITNLYWNEKNPLVYIRYSANADGSNMTQNIQPNSQYVGVGYMPKEILDTPNLVKNSNYPNNAPPPYVLNNATISTVTIDNYKCLMVETKTTGGGAGTVTGAYLNNASLFTPLVVGDDIIVSFLIKGAVNTWRNLLFEGSTELEVINKKTQYDDWERVVWRGKKTTSGGAFVWYSSATSPSQIFYIRELSIQKSTSFTGYYPAPSDWIADPNNYEWSLINTMYSSNNRGINMTSETTSDTKYVGLANISQELQEDTELYNEYILKPSNYIWSKYEENEILDYSLDSLMGLPDSNIVEINMVNALQVQSENIDNVDDIFPITNIKISNGIFNHINITKDITKNFSILIPNWNYDTILDCDFNNNINGGNTNILLSQLEGLRIKRRLKGTFNWITLKDIVIDSVDDLNIVYQDSYIPSFNTFQWALVPILNGAIEGEYIINEIESNFNGVFISNKDRIFKLYNSVGYGATTRVKNTGMIQTIGNKYPIFVNNSAVDYEQGEVTATLYGYEFETTRQINPTSVVQQTNDILSFLSENSAKIITDWNGNIKLVRINPSPTISYNQAYGNRITTISFQWTEQGVYDNQDDLYYNELIDTLG